MLSRSWRVERILPTDMDAGRLVTLRRKQLQWGRADGEHANTIFAGFCPQLEEIMEIAFKALHTKPGKGVWNTQR